MESGKTNVLLNLIKNQRPDIDKIYLYVKDLFKSKYQLLVNRREKHSLAFIDYSQTIDDIYENLEDYNPIKKRIVLIVFDDMILDMESDQEFNSIVTQLYLRGRKLKISLVLYHNLKSIRLTSTHYFIMKIPNKRELQKIEPNHSFGIDFKDFMKL